MQNIKQRTLVAALAAIGVTTIGIAHAQQAPAKVERIDVTGSNIKRVDAESSSAIQILTKEDIQRSGATSVAELLKTIPITSGGDLNDFGTQSNSFSRGVSSASLRGLGSVGTLVLINSRRVAPSANADPNTGQGSAYNLNNIPLGAIERVEILKDGASAIYGSDAVAGVINFILRKDYQGAEARVSVGSTLDNAFRNYSVTGTAGFGDLAKDRYNVMLSGEYTGRDPEDYNAPNAVQNNAYRTLASRNLPNSSSLTAIPNYRREAVLGNGAFTVALPTDPRCPAANTVAATAGCRTNAFDYIQILPKSERAGLLGKGTYDFSANLQGTVEVAYTRAKTFFISSAPTLQETPAIWFNAAGQEFRYSLILPVGHPDNPYTVPVGVRYRFEDLGLTKNVTVNDAKRVLAGLSGSHFNWDWESAFLYTETKREETANGRLYYPALLAAVANRTYRFGATNNSEAVKAALNPERFSTGKADNTSWDLKGSRELFKMPGGMAAVAVGFEARRESFNITSPSELVRGNFVGIASTTVDGSRNVNSFYTEFSLPILKNVETQVAFRRDKYSDFGSATTPKFGFKWKALESLSLRGTYTEAFRAPSLTQSSSARVQAFTTATDPLRCPNGTSPAPGGDLIDCTGRSLAIYFPSRGQLQPEKSKSWSYGFIFSPTDNIDIQADLFNISRRNEISFFPISQVIANSATDPNYIGGSLQRSTNPATFLTNAAGAPIPGTGPIETALIYLQNAAATKVKGVDVSAATRFRLGAGTVRLSALATWMIRYDYLFPGAPSFINGAGNFYLFETPKLRGNATATYTAGDWESFWRVNYQGGWEYNDPTVTTNGNCYLSSVGLTRAFLGRCQVAAWLTNDIGVSYRGIKNLTVSMVIRNIENKQAPYDPNQGTLGFNPSFHNPYGANAQLAVGYRFK